MTKQISIGEVRAIALWFVQNWANSKNNLKLAPKQLYNLIALKKTIENEFLKANEAIQTILEQNGCPSQGDGTYKIPEEKRDQITNQLNEISEQTIELEYNLIEIGDEDSISPELLDILFDFVQIK